jgi:hypothetical protein
MFVLPVASALGHQPPTIVFERSNQLAELHLADRAERLGWAMSEKSHGEHERRLIFGRSIQSLDDQDPGAAVA